MTTAQPLYSYSTGSTVTSKNRAGACRCFLHSSKFTDVLVLENQHLQLTHRTHPLLPPLNPIEPPAPNRVLLPNAEPLAVLPSTPAKPTTPPGTLPNTGGFIPPPPSVGGLPNPAAPKDGGAPNPDVPCPATV